MGFSFKSGEDLLSLCASDQDSLGEQDDTAVASPEKDRIAEREPRRVEMAPLTAELQEMMDLSWPDPPPLPTIQSRLDGCFFGMQLKQLTAPLPHFSDLHAEIKLLIFSAPTGH